MRGGLAPGIGVIHAALLTRIYLAVNRAERVIRSRHRRAERVGWNLQLRQHLKTVAHRVHIAGGMADHRGAVPAVTTSVDNFSVGDRGRR